jgi:hypothetical protein
MRPELFKLQVGTIRYVQLGSNALGFLDARKRKVVVRVAGNKIIVTLPGTNFNVTYERSSDGAAESSSDGAALVARSFGGRRDEGDKVKLPVFLASAWTAANDKARELGWIK